MNNYKILQL